MEDYPPEDKLGPNPLLVVRDLSKVFISRDERGRRAELKVLSGINITVSKGEIVGIVGESGCGKTTLAKCIVGLETATSGKVIFQDRTITSGRSRWYRKDLQLIFQDPYTSLHPKMTVGQIIGEPLLIHRLVSDRIEFRRRVSELLDLVGLQPKMANRYPHEFSGGQRQRIGIGRALAVEPSLLICDEPVSALDVSVQAQIINLLLDLRQKLDLTYVFIAHDLALVRHIATRVVVMYLGRVVESMTTERLFEQPTHPYTQGLISAVPIPDPKAALRRPRLTVKGEVPSLLNLPSGCVFETRCPLAIQQCKDRMPPLTDVGDAHMVACWRSGEARVNWENMVHARRNVVPSVGDEIDSEEHSHTTAEDGRAL